jgi:hypothetical protein
MEAKPIIIIIIIGGLKNICIRREIKVRVETKDKKQKMTNKK